MDDSMLSVINDFPESSRMSIRSILAKEGNALTFLERNIIRSLQSIASRKAALSSDRIYGLIDKKDYRDREMVIEILRRVAKAHFNAASAQPSASPPERTLIRLNGATTSFIKSLVMAITPTELRLDIESNFHIFVHRAQGAFMHTPWMPGRVALFLARLIAGLKVTCAVVRSLIAKLIVKLIRTLIGA